MVKHNSDNLSDGTAFTVLLATSNNSGSTDEGVTTPITAASPIVVIGACLDLRLTAIVLLS
jgi:hypothetical protein